MSETTRGPQKPNSDPINIEGMTQANFENAMAFVKDLAFVNRRTNEMLAPFMFVPPPDSLFQPEQVVISVYDRHSDVPDHLSWKIDRSGRPAYRISSLRAGGKYAAGSATQSADSSWLEFSVHREMRDPATGRTGLLEADVNERYWASLVMKYVSTNPDLTRALQAAKARRTGSPLRWLRHRDTDQLPQGKSSLDKTD